MSTKQKTKISGRVTSITRKLNGQIIGKKIGLYLGADFFLLVVTSLLWLLDQEWTRLGDIDFDRYHVFRMHDGIRSLEFIVSGMDEIELFRVNAFYPFAIIASIVIIALFFQMLNVILSIYNDQRRIKKILSPINEMALKADELSKMSFDEEKYHVIEDAITSISPEDEKSLSLGDPDLIGIEAAMNNMLQRMHETYMQQARFVNDASHELRTPIAVIQGYANMLDRWGKEDESILEESIEAIKHESEHMNGLVEQLLFLARGDSGRNKLNVQNVYLNDLMKEVYEESLMIDENHIYRFRNYDEHLFAEIDEGLMKQVIRILVDNASKYTKAGEEIVVSLGRNERGVPYLQVQDSGIGMAEADVQHMFERFYRADDAREYKGTGLGLSIAKWIVDKHEAHFEILSRTDLGTRIRVVLSKN